MNIFQFFGLILWSWRYEVLRRRRTSSLVGGRSPEEVSKIGKLMKKDDYELDVLLD